MMCICHAFVCFEDVVESCKSCYGVHCCTPLSNEFRRLLEVSTFGVMVLWVCDFHCDVQMLFS